MSVKIGPSLAILLAMEKANFPVPPDGRVGQAIAAMRKAGKISAVLLSDHELSASEMDAVEAIGVAFPARGTVTGATVVIEP
ncbi:MAG: hypothetical protein Q7T04_04175 [Dehalococcoidia bacterium]|nr:hypothetical protein [Dehalococcoidia bacterium]